MMTKTSTGNGDVTPTAIRQPTPSAIEPPEDVPDDSGTAGKGTTPTSSSASMTQAVGGALLLDVNALAAQLDCSPSHIWRLDRAGLLPKPLKIGRSVKWRREEIEAWIAAGAPTRSRWVWPLRKEQRIPRLNAVRP